MTAAKTLPSWDVLTKHGVFPEANHDEVARLNFLTHLNVHLSASILPGVKTAFDTQVKPEFEKEHGREPESRHEVRKAMLKHPYFQTLKATHSGGGNTPLLDGGVFLLKSVLIIK